MTDKIDVTLPLSAETVELFEHAFGANWRSRVGHLLNELAPIIAAAAAPPKRKPRKSH